MSSSSSTNLKAYANFLFRKNEMEIFFDSFVDWPPQCFGLPSAVQQHLLKLINRILAAWCRRSLFSPLCLCCVMIRECLVIFHLTRINERQGFYWWLGAIYRYQLMRSPNLAEGKGPLSEWTLLLRTLGNHNNPNKQAIPGDILTLNRTASRLFSFKHSTLIYFHSSKIDLNDRLKWALNILLRDTYYCFDYLDFIRDRNCDWMSSFLIAEWK